MTTSVGFGPQISRVLGCHSGAYPVWPSPKFTPKSTRPEIKRPAMSLPTPSDCHFARQPHPIALSAHRLQYTSRRQHKDTASTSSTVCYPTSTDSNTPFTSVNSSFAPPSPYPIALTRKCRLSLGPLRQANNRRRLPLLQEPPSIPMSIVSILLYPSTTVKSH